MVVHEPASSSPHRKPSFRRYDLAYVNHANRLSAGHGFRIPLAQTQWHVRLAPAVPCPKPDPLRVAWYLDWGHYAGILSMGSDAMHALFQACGCHCPYDAMPEAIALALGETVMADTSAALQQCGLSRLCVRRISEEPARYDGMDSIAWQARREADDLTLGGVLYVQRDAMAQLASLAAAAVAEEIAVDSWAALPVPMALEVGAVTLSLDVIKTLRTGDVVLADVSYGGRHDRALLVRISAQLAMRAAMDDDGHIITTTGVMNMPTHEQPPTTTDMPSMQDSCADDLQDLPVRIAFDLGARTVSLAQLATMRAGYVFDLGLPVSHAVTLRANGAQIGEGELVEIDGRIGVAITRIAAPQSS